jgi:hypothetical protein
VNLDTVGTRQIETDFSAPRNFPAPDLPNCGTVAIRKRLPPARVAVLRHEGTEDFFLQRSLIGWKG